jgi:hypothetical protein
MGILDSFVHDEVETFFRPLVNGSLVSFHRPKKFVDLPTLRAQIVGVMQTSPQGTRVLRAASERLSAAR